MNAIDVQAARRALTEARQQLASLTDANDANDAEIMLRAVSLAEKLPAEIDRLRAELALAVDALCTIESAVRASRDAAPALVHLDRWHRAHGWTGDGVCSYCVAADAWMPAPDGGERR